MVLTCPIIIFLMKRSCIARASCLDWILTTHLHYPFREALASKPESEVTPVLKRVTGVEPLSEGDAAATPAPAQLTAGKEEPSTTEQKKEVAQQDQPGESTSEQKEQKEQKDEKKAPFSKPLFTFSGNSDNKPKFTGSALFGSSGILFKRNTSVATTATAATKPTDGEQPKPGAELTAPPRTFAFGKKATDGPNALARVAAAADKADLSSSALASSSSDAVPSAAAAAAKAKEEEEAEEEDRPLTKVEMASGDESDTLHYVLRCKAFILNGKNFDEVCIGILKVTTFPCSTDPSRVRGRIILRTDKTRKLMANESITVASVAKKTSNEKMVQLTTPSPSGPIVRLFLASQPSEATELVEAIQKVVNILKSQGAEKGTKSSETKGNVQEEPSKEKKDADEEKGDAEKKDGTADAKQEDDTKSSETAETSKSE